MAELREVLAAEGCEEVRTYIASGNAVFRSDAKRGALAERLERAVLRTFGVDTPVMLRTPEEMAAVVERHPFGDDTSHTQVAFLAAKPSAARVRAAGALEIGSDRVTVIGAEAYWHAPGGVGRSPLTGARLERELGVPATVRNWRTVTKLAEMAADG